MTAQALPKAYHICRPLGVALHPQALVYFHPDYKNLQHPRFRVLLAHALLTLGKVPFGQEPEAAAEAQADHSYCMLDRFTAYCNEKHQCGYCKQKSYFFCSTCFPDESQAKYGICNPTAKDRPCFHKHISGVAPTHKMQHVKRVMTRESPLRRQEARTGGAGDSAGSARRRHEF